jgi:Flp pilus assembly secretin CpaC
MLKTIASSVLLLALVAAAPARATESASPDGSGKDTSVLDVTIDQAKIERVPTGTSTLVIGNPMIADVTMLKGGVGMVVTGKGYGQTNIIALDDRGNVLFERQLRVAPTNSVLVVQRGDSRSSYSCNPICMPTVQLGDDTKVFGDAGSQIQQRNGYASATNGK